MTMDYTSAFKRYQQPAYGRGITPDFEFDRPLWADYHEDPSARWRTYESALSHAPGYSFLSPLYQNEAQRGFNARNAQYILNQYMPLLQGNLAPNAAAPDAWQGYLGGTQGANFDIGGGLGNLWNAYQTTGADREALDEAGFNDAIEGMLVDSMMQGQTGMRRQYLNAALNNRLARLQATRGPEGFDLFNAWAGGRLGDVLGLGFANRADAGYIPDYLTQTTPPSGTPVTPTGQQGTPTNQNQQQQNQGQQGRNSPTGNPAQGGPRGVVRKNELTTQGQTQPNRPPVLPSPTTDFEDIEYHSAIAGGWRPPGHTAISAPFASRTTDFEAIEMAAAEAAAQAAAKLQAQQQQQSPPQGGGQGQGSPPATQGPPTPTGAPQGSPPTTQDNLRNILRRRQQERQQAQGQPVSVNPLMSPWGMLL